MHLGTAVTWYLAWARENDVDPDAPPVVKLMEAVAAKYDRQNTRAQTISAINTAIKLASGRDQALAAQPDVQNMLRRKTMPPRNDAEAARRVEAEKKSVAWDLQPVLQKMDERVRAGVSKLTDRTLIDYVMMAMRVEAGYRGTDVQRAPWMPWSRFPVGKALRDCTWFEIRTYAPKEHVLRGTRSERHDVWSDPVRVHRHGGEAGLAVLMQEMERRMLRDAGGSHPTTYTLGGVEVYARCFCRKKQKVAGSNRYAFKPGGPGELAQPPTVYMLATNTLTLSTKRVFAEAGVDHPPSTVRHSVATYIQHMVVANEVWTKRQLSDFMRHKEIATTQGTYAKNVPPKGPHDRFLEWMQGHEDWRVRLSPLRLGELMRV